MKAPQIKQLWDSVLPHRFIMTFRVESFTVPKLEERLNDLTEQGIFKPEMMIIDGLHCDESLRPALVALKALAGKNGMHVWFTVHTHRHEKPGQDGLPASFSPVADLFDLVLELQTEHADIHIKPLKGAASATPAAALLLDPSTMLIKDRSRRIMLNAGHPADSHSRTDVPAIRHVGLPALSPPIRMPGRASRATLRSHSEDSDRSIQRHR